MIRNAFAILGRLFALCTVSRADAIALKDGHAEQGRVLEVGNDCVFQNHVDGIEGFVIEVPLSSVSDLGRFEIGKAVTFTTSARSREKFGDSALARRSPGQAMNEYRTAMGLDGKTISTAPRAKSALSGIGDPIAAGADPASIRDLAKARDGRLVTAFLDLGHEYARRGNFKQASRHLGLAVSVDPSDPRVEDLRVATTSAPCVAGAPPVPLPLLTGRPRDPGNAPARGAPVPRPGSGRTGPGRLRFGESRAPSPRSPAADRVPRNRRAAGSTDGGIRPSPTPLGRRPHPCADTCSRRRFQPCSSSHSPRART